MWSRRRKIVVGVIAALFVLLIAGRMVSVFAVDLLWYRSLGFDDVFWTRWWITAGVRVTVGLLAAVFVFLNLRIAARALENVRIRRRYANIEIEERIPRSWVLAVATGVALFSGWWLSLGMGNPIEVAAAFVAPAWGEADPIFGRDFSFYVFTLPIIGRLQILAGVLLFWTFLLVLVAYVATTSVRWSETGPVITPLARRHLGMLAAAALLVLAWDFWLDRYQLLVSGQGVGGALGYTDVHARIPARVVTTFLAAVAAGAVGYGAWVGSLRPPAIALGVLILGGVVGQGVYPSLLQRLLVEPDELNRESAYIEMNLALTRRAYDLTDLDRRALPHDPGDRPDAAALEMALGRVPLWDPRPLRRTYAAQQALFRYYDFVSLHYDRYGPPGDQEQVVISVRELDVGGLPAAAQTWQNLHLNWVHGAGAVVTPASRMGAGGEPAYWLRDLSPPRVAPTAPPELELTDPEIYFGERTRGYVVLDPDMTPAERRGDEPVGPEERDAAPVPVGVTLDAFWKRAMFAWAFQSRNLILSGQITPQSRITYRREVVERVREVVPFLAVPAGGRAGPYPVIHEGRVVWIVDGYTTSSAFPMAAASRFADRTVRYVRNSVKITVDAVTGEVGVFSVDPDDPVLHTYAGIFPGLIRPVEEMPEGLRRHLRFPPVLFQLQTAVLSEYHLRDARAFYYKEDVWDIPTEIYQNRAIMYEPFFTILPLPGEEGSEFALTTPFVAAGRQNMTAFFVTRNDPPRYGEQILYELPRDELIPGPQQIEALIDQNPEIAEQLALWQRAGSSVIRGNMAVVPIGDTFVYLEPVFLEAQEGAIPQLERVILASARRVVMRPTLAEAISALLDPDAPAEAGRRRVRLEEPDDPADPAEREVEAPPAVPAIETARAREVMQRAERQLREGDWAAFGESWEQLRRILQEEEGGSP